MYVAYKNGDIVTLESVDGSMRMKVGVAKLKPNGFTDFYGAEWVDSPTPGFVYLVRNHPDGIPQRKEFCVKRVASGSVGGANKYRKEIRSSEDGVMDVYDVLDTFNVTCPARAHAIKKLLFAGKRGKGSAVQDLREAGEAVKRAAELEEGRNE